MPAPISIVIPTLDVADRIGPCLGALAEGLHEGLIHELILSDGGSIDQISEVADAVGARLITAPRGRGAQLSAGAGEARGPWLLLLHADSELQEGWTGAVRHHLRQHPERAGYFRLRFSARGPMAHLTSGWANMRARWLGLPFGDQGLLVPSAMLQEVGGVPDLPLMEDVALARRLRGRLRRLDAEIVTSAERYQKNGWLRQGVGNLWRQVRFLCGARPERLLKGYERR